MKKQEYTDLDTIIYIVGIMAISLKALISFSDLLQWVPSIVHSALGGMFIVCMVIKFARQRYIVKYVLGIGFLGICCLFTYMSARYYYLLSTFFCLIALQDVDIKQVLQISSKFKAVFLAVHFVIYELVVIVAPAYATYSYRSGVGEPRHTYFMSHANTVTMYIVWTSLEYIYCTYEKLTMQKLLGIWLINFISHYFTDSNTGFIVATFVTIFIICDKYKKETIMKLVHLGARYGFLMCSVIFNLMIVSYTSLSGPLLELFHKIDDFFTGRLLYGAVTYDLKGCTLMGRILYFDKKTYWLGHWFDTITCDNTYVWFFVCYGMLYIILLSFAFWWIGKKTTNIEKIMIFSYVFYAAMENYVINVVFCFPLFLIGKYVFLSQKEFMVKRKDHKRKGRLKCVKKRSVLGG